LSQPGSQVGWANVVCNGIHLVISRLVFLNEVLSLIPKFYLGMPSTTLCVVWLDAERPGMGSQTEFGNQKNLKDGSKVKGGFL